VVLRSEFLWPHALSPYDSRVQFQHHTTKCLFIIEAHSSAMAANTPDPRLFESWEDAFQYPIPTVRKFEQQLRQHADDNRQKLRNLVGYVLHWGFKTAWIVH